MATTAASLKARFTDLASLADAVVNACIEEATRAIAAGNWSVTADYDDAVLYLAAHKATLASLGGSAAGPVSSMTAGSMSRSYAVASSTGGMDDLDATAPGRMFRAKCAGNLTLATPLMIC